MGKLKQSEEEIIKLGERIVKELNLEPGVDTLGKWMAHYVAELIKKIEKSSSKSEKEENQKECFEVILKLWNNREHLPMASKPLSDMEPLLELLDVLKKDDFSYPFWRQFKDIPDSPTWKSFMDTVKSNSESIFELCIYSIINYDVLRKKPDWLTDHKNMLSKTEIKMIEHLEYLINRSNSIIIYSEKTKAEAKLNELSESERYLAIFDKIELALDEMKIKLKTLRESVVAE
jgi:hypothetical protein